VDHQHLVAALRWSTTLKTVVTRVTENDAGFTDVVHVCGNSCGAQEDNGRRRDSTREFACDNRENAHVRRYANSPMAPTHSRRRTVAAMIMLSFNMAAPELEAK
jgi:hypothetical protein